MKYGYFDDKNKEYVITNPYTPVKWINYIGTINFGGFVDHTGGALICCGDPALNRITRYITILPGSEIKGTSLYIKIKEPDGSFTLLSPFLIPTMTRLELYECRVGLQYTKIISELLSIRTEVTIFVPIGKKTEIRDIKITNLSDKPREIDLIPVVEYTHFDALKQLTNADWVPQTMQSKAVNHSDNYILTQYAFMNKDVITNYFTTNKTISSFETDRRIFLGNNEYGSWSNPLALQKKELSNSEAYRGDNIGALMMHLGELKPNQSERLIIQLGQTNKIENAINHIEFFNIPENVDKAFNEIKAFWTDHLKALFVATPDSAFNSMINIHNPKQCYITKNWSRYLSLYQLGYGASRGIGYRDSCQDILAVIPFKPAESKEFLTKILSTQRKDGSAMHQFNPLSMEASVGDAAEKKDRPQYYSDDHLWGIIAACKYIKESGDFAYLDEVIPFYQFKNDESPEEKGSLLEHLKRAIEFTEHNKGRNGIPLLGFADWNDTCNLPAGAESLFTANLFGLALKEIIALLEFINDSETAEKYKKYYDTIKNAVNTKAWDGEWYIRYLDHEGNTIGSNKNDKGKIFVNAQSWAVISGFADSEKAKSAMESVNKHLSTSNGIKVMSPSYNGYDEIKGGITTYPPGAKENGGIFLHTNPWVMIAETLLGNGDRAYQYYNQINPAAKNDSIDIYECEPYCYAQNILSDEHPQFGLARNSWLTGTASWAYQAATEYILGIRASYNGLIIDPCIPSKWAGFKSVRIFRGKTYNIEVKNPQNISKGKIHLTVDGKPIEGNIIPLNLEEKNIDVLAEIKE